MVILSLCKLLAKIMIIYVGVMKLCADTWKLIMMSLNVFTTFDFNQYAASGHQPKLLCATTHTTNKG